MPIMVDRKHGETIPRTPVTRPSLVVGAAICVALFASGCPRSGTTKTAGSSNAEHANSKPPAGPAAPSQRCQTLLSSSIEMMQPENLGISADAKSAVDSLNNWVRDCGKSVAAEAGGPKDAALDKFLPEAERASANAELYDIGDIEHVRNCRLFKQASANVLRTSTSDVDRVVGLFELANRLIAISGPIEPTIPQTAFESLVVGRGTAEDRAWIFAELLRQAGFDALILRPQTRDSAKPMPPARWLVGVPIEKQVYLFDTALGWPIPSAEDKGNTPTVRRPATLAEAAANDALLRKLDVSAEKPYPLKADDLKSLRAEIITSSRYWLPRIKRLENFLSGNRSATVYAALGDVGNRPGLLSRTAAAGAGFWKKDDVTVWDYPNLQGTAARNLDLRAMQARELRWLPFEGPVKVDFDKDTLQLQSKGGDRKEIKSRTSQLQGDCPSAIRNFLLVQLEELQPAMILPPAIQKEIAAKQGKPLGDSPVGIEVPKREFAMNYRAAEDAKFWMAVCQMEQNEFESAAENFGAYLRGYGARGGIWIPQAALLRGIVLAHAQQYALAVQSVNQILRALPDDDPRRSTFELFATRWRTTRDAAKPQEQNSPDSTKTPSAPASDKTSAATPPTSASAPAASAPGPPSKPAVAPSAKKGGPKTP